MKIIPNLAMLTFLGVFLCEKLTAGKPNVIFVLADDLGWAELGLSLIHI